MIDAFTDTITPDLKAAYRQFGTSTSNQKVVSAAIVVVCHHRPDLLALYLPSIVKYSDGARLIVVNNGNDPEVHKIALTIVPYGEAIYLDGYHSRAEALNFALANIEANVIVTLDDDIEATGPFMPQMLAACLGGAFAGFSEQRENWLTDLNGRHVPYLELGHSASRETWARLGPNPIEYKHWFVDVEMCLRARALGIPVVALEVPLVHRNGQTIDRIYERNAGVMADRAVYQERCAKYAVVGG